MKLALVVLHIVLVGTQIWASSHYREDLEDNEFAEFEDFEEDEEVPVAKDADDQQGQAAKGRKVAETQELDEEEEEEEYEDAIVEVLLKFGTFLISASLKKKGKLNKISK